MESFVRTKVGERAGATPDGESISTIEQESATQRGWVLKELKGKHKNICSLVAQGVPRQQVALICDVTPEYVSMLLRQPLCMQFIARMNEAVDVQLEALHSASVEAIGRALTTGNNEDALKAARLQMEATGRVGPKQQATQGEAQTDKLDKLADRLLGLLDRQRGRVINVDATEVTERVQGDGLGSERTHSLPEADSDGLPAGTGSQFGITVPQAQRQSSEQDS